MWKMIILSVLQCLLLASGQMFLKIATGRIEKFSFTWKFFVGQLNNWPLLYSGLSMTAATVLWLYIIKHLDFSLAYPLTSLSYVFGMLAAAFVFNESVPLTRWIGVALVMAGVIFIVK